MRHFDERLRGALIGNPDQNSRLGRARALDADPAEVEQRLTDGDSGRARELVQRMRRFIVWTTTENGPAHAVPPSV